MTEQVHDITEVLPKTGPNWKMIATRAAVAAVAAAATVAVINKLGSSDEDQVNETSTD